MNAAEIIQGLEDAGYTLTAVDGKIHGDRQALRPPPKESKMLLDQLRQHKGEALNILLYRDFTEVPATEGDLHIITADATNEREMLRWALAVDAGIIALVDKTPHHPSKDTALIRYRCPFPVEWLSDAITRAAKQRYNHVLERIQKGEQWLRDNKGSHDYERLHARFLALCEDLRLLELAVGEVPCSSTA